MRATYPWICHFCPFFSSSPYARTVLFCSSSDGKLHRQNRNSHNGKEQQINSTKMPPPLFPTMYGNFHTFPMPMAQPAESRRKPRRDWNVSRSISFISSLFLRTKTRFQNGTVLPFCPVCLPVLHYAFYYTFLIRKDKQLLRACLKIF